MIYFKRPPRGLYLWAINVRSAARPFFPKADFCTQCLNKELEEMPLSKRGTLYSYTITRVPVGRYPIPHPIGMVNAP